MRVGPVAHGALLVAALGFGYQTWTRDKTEPPKVGTVPIWDESVSDFESFAYDGENKSVRVERREEGGHAYYWGQVTRTEKKRKPRVPVKSPTDPNVVEPKAQGGLPGGHGGGAGRPAAAGKEPATGKPAAPASGTKKPEPSQGAGSGSSSKPPQQRALSPHHAATDQPEQSKSSAPAQGQGTGASPAKPASGGAPAKPGADKKAAAGDKPAATGAAPVSEPGDDEPGEEDEGDTADGDTKPATEPEPTTTKVKEFPIGKSGETLINNLAHLRALRDLGVLTDKQKDEYSLTDSKENLTVFFKGGKRRSLIIGARVFGGGDRYVMNPDNGRGYVLSNSEIMRHIDGSETSLGIKNLHSFQEEMPEQAEGPHDAKGNRPKRDKYPGVGHIDVETLSGSRSVVRFEQPDPETGGTKIGWADKKKPNESDVSFANFLTQIERLKPLEYDPTLDLATLTKVITITYKNAGGELLGTFELYKKEPTVTPELEPSEESKKANAPEYFVKTELTRVAGEVPRMSAERVTEDLPQLFGAPPKKKAATPGNPAKPGADKPTSAGAGGGKPADVKPANPSEGSTVNPTEGNK